MRKRMCVPMMTLCLLLAGCAGGGGGEKTADAAALRAPYMNMTGCTMEAAVTWSEGEQLWETEVLCEYVPGGETTVEVLSPETIAGVRAVLSDGETALVYAPQMLEFASYDSLQHVILGPWMEGKLKFPCALKPGDELWPQAVCLYQEIWQASKIREAGPYLRLKAGLYRLFACFFEGDQMIRTGADDEEAGNMDSLKKVLEFVRQNYGRRIRVEEAAAVAGMNPQYFCRYFKKHTGRTVTEYINDVRISQASRLLAQTDDKILHIAVRCGYENAGYFISRFRRSRGVSPSEYREQMKKSR